MNARLNPNALITADDWGMSPGINDGILELAKKGIVRRVSCMAKGKYLSHRVSELASVPGIELGLHFDLTFGKTRKETFDLVFRSFFSPGAIRTSVLESFRAQWSSLKSAGINATYLDGHHHVHLLPGVLSALLEEARFAGVKRVRTVLDPFLMLSTKFPLVFLSVFARSKLKASGLSTLPMWYPKLERIGLLRFRNRLQALKTPTEIIVHPARTNDLASLAIDDSYTDGRVGEFQLLEQLCSQTV